MATPLKNRTPPLRVFASLTSLAITLAASVVAIFGALQLGRSPARYSPPETRAIAKEPIPSPRPSPHEHTPEHHHARGKTSTLVAIGRLERQIYATSHTAARTAQGIKEIEAVMLENPAEAVSYTLLKREVQANQSGNAAALADVESSFAKEYDLMKLLVGVLGLGILGMIVPIGIAAVKSITS
jgi:hypothetical protein